MMSSESVKPPSGRGGGASRARMKAASQRELFREFDELERCADERDRMADERDRMADERERAGDDRERVLDELEPRLDDDGAPGSGDALLDRTQEAIRQAHKAVARSQAMARRRPP